MPTVNIYLCENHVQAGYPAWDKTMPELRALIAKELSCGERELQPGEISIRLLGAHGHGMIAPIEIDVTAHAYAERVRRSNEICLAIRTFVLSIFPKTKDVRIWLTLTELGHSWEE